MLPIDKKTILFFIMLPLYAGATPPKVYCRLTVLQWNLLSLRQKVKSAWRQVKFSTYVASWWKNRLESKQKNCNFLIKKQSWQSHIISFVFLYFYNNCFLILRPQAWLLSKAFLFYFSNPSLPNLINEIITEVIANTSHKIPPRVKLNILCTIHAGEENVNCT